MSSTIGILGPSLSSLKIVFQALLSTKPWLQDPEVINMPWQHDDDSVIEDGRSAGLSFGILKSNDQVRPHPPIQRALNIVADALKGDGHDVSDPILRACSSADSTV